MADRYGFTTGCGLSPWQVSLLSELQAITEIVAYLIVPAGGYCPLEGCVGCGGVEGPFNKVVVLSPGL